MRARQKAQAPVLQRRILERIPEAHGARRVRVQEGAVLVRGHGAADLRLLAYDHALKASRVAVAQRARDGRRARPHARRRRRLGRPRRPEQRCERRAERVQVVADLVDGARLGLGQVAPVVEGVLLEEEADLVAAGQEVVVAHVVLAVLAARAELGHRVVLQREVLQQRVRLRQQRGDCGRGQCVRDNQVAVALEVGELRGREAAVCWTRDRHHV